MYDRRYLPNNRRRSAGVVPAAAAERAVAGLRREIALRDRAIADRDRAIADRERALSQRDREVADRDREIARLRAQLARQETAPPQAREIPEPAKASQAGELERLAADLANVRRHQQTAIDAGVREARGRLLVEVLAVRDNLERALAMPGAQGGGWQQGARALLGKIDRLLTREGAQLIGEAGERFDPHRHEAVATAAGRGAAGEVVEVIRPGLLLDEQLLVRPAQVVVAV
mgnify:CR=1 FL=1